MKMQNDILETLKGKKQYLEDHFSVDSIGLFGSYARNDFDEKSDIDILVTFLEPTFDHYMELKFFLEDLCGRSVDLVLKDTIKKRLKEVIAQETLHA